MSERMIDEMREKYHKLSKTAVPEDVATKIHAMIEDHHESNSTKRPIFRRGYLTTGVAVMAAVLMVFVSVVTLKTNTPQNTVLQQSTTKYTVPKTAPALIRNIEPDQIEDASIDGWGPGASGNYVSFLYNPFGAIQAKALLMALQHGKRVTDKNLVTGMSQGGDAWLALHLSNGHLLAIQEVTHTLGYTNGPPPRNTFWVSIDHNSNGVFIREPDGKAAQLYQQLWELTSNFSTEKPDWLTNLSTSDIQTVTLDESKGEEWNQQPLSDSSGVPSSLISALQTAQVVYAQSVDTSKVFGFRSHWRTNSISLGLAMKDGSTIHINGPYTTRANVMGHPNVPVFKVAYSSANAYTSVYVEDKSGKIVEYWNQHGLNES